MNFIKMIFVFVVLIFTMNMAIAQNPNFKFHKPAYQTEAEKALRTPVDLDKTILYKSFPSNITLPGEYEESQSVVISWAFDYDNLGNVIGVDTYSVYGYVSAQLAMAIQPECPVWIRINKGSDSTIIKQFMKNIGEELYNYKFFINVGDDWWTRDFGPMAIYFGKQDSIGFVDMKYYSGRDNDDKFPQQLAAKLAYPNFVTKLNSEGGNLMTDGFGKLFFSDVIPTVNNNLSVHNPSWPQTQSFDTLRNIFNTPELINFKSLKCDGGTGHIDLFVKLMDEQTLFVSQYPQEITANDKNIIEDNYQLLLAMKSTYNRPYRIFRIEHPTDDNGNHTRKTCSQINADARNFINGLTINKTYIYPSYYDGETGNAEQHNRVLELHKKLLPGYKIVPIDSRELSILGGAIHCITMQIPSENPIRFWHPSIDGLQPNMSKFHIISKVTNKSGIFNVRCFWRKNTGVWNMITLTDSSGYFVGDIVNPGLSATDEIHYYLSATSFNGKTAFKPIQANSNSGYYRIRMSYPNATEEMVIEKDHLFSAFPNPASTNVNIKFKNIDLADMTLKVCDLTGKTLFAKTYHNLVPGTTTEQIDISNWKNAMYFISLSKDAQPISVRKLIISN